MYAVIERRVRLYGHGASRAAEGDGMFVEIRVGGLGKVYTGPCATLWTDECGCVSGGSVGIESGYGQSGLQGMAALLRNFEADSAQ